MHKKILTEQAIYYGDAKMPEGWDLNKDFITTQIGRKSEIKKWTSDQEKRNKKTRSKKARG